MSEKPKKCANCGNDEFLTAHPETCVRCGMTDAESAMICTAALGQTLEQTMGSIKELFTPHRDIQRDCSKMPTVSRADK